MAHERRTMRSPLALAAAASALGFAPAFCQSCRGIFRPGPRPGSPLARYAAPPLLDLYTSKGVVSAPMPQLPAGKQSVFEGLPLLQTDAVGDPGLGALLTQFAGRLVSEFQLLDLMSALLILMGLSLGVLDTQRRWISYASDAITWSLYEAMGGPDRVIPGRLVPGTPAEVERATLSWPNMRELLAFLQQARVPDRLRAAAAADAATAQRELRLLAEAVLLACSDALLLDPETPLPAIDGEWECACDYFRNGNVIFVPMRLRGESGSYTADGGRHDILNIQRRREGSLVVADFRWENSAGASGSGKWLVSREGNFIAGNWRQDGVEEGPWSWYGRKKPSLRTPPPPEVARARAREGADQDTRVTDLGPVAIKAGAAAVQAAGSDAGAREAVAQAWDNSAPVQPSGTGGDLAPSAVLRRRWLAAGEDLRAVLGLTLGGLVPENVQRLGFALALALWSISALFFARALALSLGSSADAATWSFFFASYAVILDIALPTRAGLAPPATANAVALRQKRLEQLRLWAENGGLVRRGATPRDELLKAVRRVLEPGGSGEAMRDSEVEELLKVWNPAMKRQVLRTSRLSKGAMITYENVSIVPGKEPRSIW
ncbi:DHAR2 [Symbiodinium natans]|uniref:DHAR2 protein n=1 Tax=Symbiodinium natans TaxID=878477 RepID=A0A812QXR8_9DINO|nr:DHAR2 [Symbiodinium natans]